MEWFNGVPDKPGLYWFAEQGKDWDLRIPVGVRQLSDAIQSWTEVKIGGEFIDCRSERFVHSLWFGPLPQPPRPSDVLVTSVSR